MKLNKYWESFCNSVLEVSTTLKMVFSRWNFSNNFVQVLSPYIPTCSYCIYYCSLPSSSASPSSLRKITIALCLVTCSDKTTGVFKCIEFSHFNYIYTVQEKPIHLHYFVKDVLFTLILGVFPKIVVKRMS